MLAIHVGAALARSFTIFPFFLLLPRLEYTFSAYYHFSSTPAIVLSASEDAATSSSPGPSPRFFLVSYHSY